MRQERSVQQTMDDAYLSSGEAARHLGIAKVTLLRAVARGEITPRFRTPRGYTRFHAADVEAYARHLSGKPRSRDAGGRV